MPPLLAPQPERTVDPGPKPTFSIVIAAYQVARYLADAIDSALTQSEPALEVIVCDDGSTDEIDATLEPYRDRIVFLRQKHRGVAAAKNTAAWAASGDFLTLLDGDDIYLPGRLEALAAMAQARPDLDILVTDAHVVLDGVIQRRAYDETWAFEVSDQRRAILDRCFIIGNAAVRRTAFLAAEGFDETLSAAVDWDLWLRMILNGARAGLVPEPLAQYRVRPGSISTKRTTVLENGLYALRRIGLRDDLTPEERQTLERTLGSWSRQLSLVQARTALLERDPKARRQLLAIALSPGHTLSSRVKAAASSVTPRWAGAVLSRREQTSWEGASGLRVRRSRGESRP